MVEETIADDNANEDPIPTVLIRFNIADTELNDVCLTEFIAAVLLGVAHKPIPQPWRRNIGIKKKILVLWSKLDIKNGLLIKGINLEGLRVLGSPEYFAKKYYDHGIDEVCYVDNVATLYGTNNLSKFISATPSP